ncbi:MAG: long-chain fatty acid--CoA ligase [Trueperaceae bacterium]|nr:MAG: long-chain fatty acid--CoA ligase [Trueperaceae bacterium]
MNTASTSSAVPPLAAASGIGDPLRRSAAVLCMSACVSPHVGLPGSWRVAVHRRTPAPATLAAPDPAGPAIVALVHTVLHAIATHPPAREALRCGDTGTSFGALARTSLRWASLLSSLHGVVPGDRVALLAEPGAAFVAALLAVWRTRSAALVLTPLHPPSERERLLDDADVRVLIATPALADEARRCAGERIVVVPEGDPWDAPGGGVVASSPADAGAEVALPRLDDIALLVYTSGTTSRPKGVVLRHRHVAAQCSAIARAWRLGPDDTLVHALPLHHVHGLIIALLCTLTAGGRVVALPRFDPAAVVAAAAEGTVFMGVPTMYARLVEHLERLPADAVARASAALAALRLCTSGSAALPVTIGERWRLLAGRYPVERFGMTELGVALSNRVDGHTVPGSVGWPLPGVRIRVVDDHGAAADEGELQVCGATVFEGYWRQPRATDEAFTVDDGARWFRTGDTVRLRDDGCVQVLGRTSVDILKSAGYKISAPAIEEAIRRHPDVVDAAVVGVADETYGQVVAAAVVARAGTPLTSDGLLAFLADELAPYQRPRIVRLVAELPRNAMGKVVKPTLARMLAADWPA